uniref:Uncharacterized protein n=1 Tax=Arundo donax TaxID=35708 RepID=A0A0A8YYH0_ARUDO
MNNTAIQSDSLSSAKRQIQIFKNSTKNYTFSEINKTYA